MLVKLGESWIDPSVVEVIRIPTALIYPEDNRTEILIEAVIKGRDYIIGRMADPDEAVSRLDELASIINAALYTQSYGGEVEEKTSVTK